MCMVRFLVLLIQLQESLWRCACWCSQTRWLRNPAINRLESSAEPVSNLVHWLSKRDHWYLTHFGRFVSSHCSSIFCLESINSSSSFPTLQRQAIECWYLTFERARPTVVDSEHQQKRMKSGDPREPFGLNFSWNICLPWKSICLNVRLYIALVIFSIGGDSRVMSSSVSRGSNPRLRHVTFN